MKYFNMTVWTSASNEATTNAVGTYESYIQSIVSELPLALRSLALHEISLNDANITSFEMSVDKRELRIAMMGDVPTHPRQPFGWHIVLNYGSVEHFTCKDDFQGVPGPQGYGDHGFDEIEVLDSGTYEHRMLFSSGIELAIQFREFSIDLKPADSGDLIA